MRTRKRALLLPWAGGDTSMAYTNKVKALSPIAYWPLAESSGTIIVDESGNGRNGTYTGVDLGQTGIGDGRTCPLFDGVNDVGNVFSASLQGAFNGSEGTIALWAKVSGSGVWTDAATRWCAIFRVDGNNLVGIQRSTTNNRLQVTYIAGATNKTITKDSLTTTNWMHVAITWSKAADQVIMYFGGVQNGATLTVLGTWAGSLATTATNIGARFTTPDQIWDGYLAHVALWTTPLNSTQIASLAVVP